MIASKTTANNNNKNNKKIVVDIDVSNCKIIAFKPEIQTLMPNDDVGKNLFWNTVEIERLDKRVMGELKGNGLKTAQEIVNKYGSMNTTGIYGSIEIDENDFVPSVNNNDTI
ncbi:MAG: hypothetical protein MRJ93_04860 [Nitrososphaeraceae archaeon]|nr:hypothetical protein [Nitrososphaeraceae archaeon]